MSVVHNEKTKLLANALDRASTACFTVGVATLLAGYVYGILIFAEPATSWLALTAGCWLTIAIGLHIAARRVLIGLKP